MPVDTSKVKDRRSIKYASLQDMLVDLDTLSRGNIKALGNWSPGQVFMHLARAFNDSIDGSDMHLSWHLRMLGPMIKLSVLNGPMSAGVKLPARAARVLVPGPTGTEDGIAALRAAIARLESDPKRAPNPFFGPMTKDEWDRLHLNHAALHMSFLVPEGQ